ncbi:MAG: UDP-N-acetylmuramoyl-L-alanyl-D-glutamate--2,6-diaminopimelate ligase [Endomicrobium sp.]|nr:UDP-N-acetylmuramoyl-L-alanyl-D-glutamate--2,6-diaminopimelate ligase [Endomicrobium sp.]
MLLGEEDIILLGNNNTNVNVLGLSYDSRKIKNYYAFFAISGSSTDGKKYIDEAILKGACVIITDSDITVTINTNIIYIVVKDIIKFMSRLSAKFYKHPDKMLTVIGVTGTNGKTTITYMLESIFKYCGIKCGVIGTINYRYNNQAIQSINTTPQSLDIYRIMREMLDTGVSHLIMEVSSHALSIGRVHGISFSTAIFTNLTSDHLDFHKNLQNYFQAKSILFRDLFSTKMKKSFAIINVDDYYGKKLLKLKINAVVQSYSLLNNNITNWKITNIKLDRNYTSFNFLYHKVYIEQIGLYNVYNAVAALIAAICNGVSLMTSIKGLSTLKRIPGRLEQIYNKHLGYYIIIDYAHTIDALKNVLQTIRKISYHRLITVFGCGGNRDKTKRAIMGQLAVNFSDIVFVTSDNPRFEDPYQIISDIITGIKQINKKNYKIVLNRATAIRQAINIANKGDTILIAGKGHEKYQIIADKKLYFDDVKIVKDYIKIIKNNK